MGWLQLVGWRPGIPRQDHFQDITVAGNISLGANTTILPEFTPARIGEIRIVGGSGIETIQAAIDDTPVGGMVFIPPGTYALTTSIKLKDGVSLVGAGYKASGGTAITTTGSIWAVENTSSVANLRIENLTVDISGNTSASGAFNLVSGFNSCELRNIRIAVASSGTVEGIRINNSDSAIGTHNNHFYNITVGAGTTGATSIGIRLMNAANENKFFGGTISGIETGISVEDATNGCSFYSPHVTSFTTGITLVGTSAFNRLYSPRLENSPTSGTGINIAATANRNVVFYPQFSGLTTELTDSSSTSAVFLMSASGGVLYFGGSSGTASMGIGTTIASPTTGTIIDAPSGSVHALTLQGLGGNRGLLLRRVSGTNTLVIAPDGATDDVLIAASQSSADLRITAGSGGILELQAPSSSVQSIDLHRFIPGGVTERARVSTAGVIIGTTGTTAAITAHLSGTATLDFDLTSVVSQDLTITVTSAAVGDTVCLGIPNGSVTADTGFFAWVSATNTVTVRAFRLAGTPNPASGTFRADVWQH